MGRKPQFDTSIRLLINKATLERVQAVLEPGENRLELIRGAIDKEVSQREKLSERDGGSE